MSRRTGGTHSEHDKFTENYDIHSIDYLQQKLNGTLFL